MKLSQLCKCCVVSSCTGHRELNSNPSAAKEDEGPTNLPDFTHSVFGNKLIFDRIIQHLGIPDLKILRQTCKFLMTKVNGSRRFISNARVTITDESIAENGLGDTLEWENARIFFDQTSAQHSTKIQNHCHSIQDLQLFQTKRSPEHRVKAQRERRNRSAYLWLLKLPQFPNIRSLTLDLSLLDNYIAISALEKMVSVLKNLHLTFSDFPNHQHRWFEMNLEKIAGLEWRLDSFAITGENNGFFILELVPDAIGSILISSTSTLTTIVVNCNVAFSAIRQIQGIRFARLRNIEFQLEGYENENKLADFRTPALAFKVEGSSGFNPPQFYLLISSFPDPPLQKNQCRVLPQGL